MKKSNQSASSSGNYLGYRQHQGFTLVEIMVALTIGLLMMAGILQISLANKESSRLQRNMGFVQENTRSAMELLARDIRAAGYYEDDDPNPANRILTPILPFIVATTTDGGGANNDVITVNYESDVDCLGQATYDVADATEVASNHFARNRYFIEDERLKCQGTRGTPQPLVDGVESLQILYGENTDGDPRSANRYVKPNDANIADVVSVRIGMRFVSREAVRPTADTNPYALLDADAFTPVGGDRRLRREITTTISLRNL